MSSPTFSDALSYVVDAQAEILSAVADWKSYADVARKHIPKPMKIRAECSEASTKGWRRCARKMRNG